MRGPGEVFAIMESLTDLAVLESDLTVLIVLFAMLLVLVVSGAVAAYVAFPHIDQDLPGARRLGETLHKARELLPTLNEDEQQLLRR